MNPEMNFWQKLGTSISFHVMIVLIVIWIIVSRILAGTMTFWLFSLEALWLYVVVNNLFKAIEFRKTGKLPDDKQD